MMRILVLLLLLLGAQFSATAFAPAQAGKGWILWPFAADSRSLTGMVGGVPQQSASSSVLLLVVLAGLSTLGFLGAAASLFGFLVPAGWWAILVPASAILSLLLHILYSGPLAILPILVDALLLWGVFVQHWSASSL